MPLACIHCGMRALLAGEPPPFFDESPEAHMARCHPDMRATVRERAQMERELALRAVIVPSNGHGPH